MGHRASFHKALDNDNNKMTINIFFGLPISLSVAYYSSLFSVIFISHTINIKIVRQARSHV